MNLDINLEKYAELAVKTGINLKEGEGLIIGGNLDTLPLLSCPHLQSHGLNSRLGFLSYYTQRRNFTSENFNTSTLRTYYYISASPCIGFNKLNT